MLELYVDIGGVFYQAESSSGSSRMSIKRANKQMLLAYEVNNFMK